MFMRLTTSRFALRQFAVLTFLASPAAMAQLGGVGNVPLSNRFNVPPNVPVQPLNCSVSSVPSTVRSEGFSELLGDIRLTCSGALQVNSRNWRVGVDAAPAATLAQLVNLSVSLGVPLTSRLTGGTNMTEALLFIGGANGEEATNALPGTSLTNQNPLPHCERQFERRMHHPRQPRWTQQLRAHCRQ